MSSPKLYSLSAKVDWPPVHGPFHHRIGDGKTIYEQLTEAITPRVPSSLADASANHTQKREKKGREYSWWPGSHSAYYLISCGSIEYELLILFMQRPSPSLSLREWANTNVLLLGLLWLLVSHVHCRMRFSAGTDLQRVPGQGIKPEGPSRVQVTNLW